MNSVLKEAILETCLRACRLSSERRTVEAIRVLKELHGLMELYRRVRDTETWLCVEAIR